MTFIRSTYRDFGLEYYAPSDGRVLVVAGGREYFSAFTIEAAHDYIDAQR